MAKSKRSDFATIPPSMTILSDHAILREREQPREVDLFELESKLGMAFDIIRHKDTQEPVTIAVYGDWGVGKTSGMRWLKQQLEEWSDLDAAARNGHKKVRTVWFDPWKYQTREDVWRGLIAEVILHSIDLEKASLATVTNAVKRFGLFLGRSFVNVVASAKLKVGAKEIGGQVDLDLQSLKTIVDDYHATNRPEKAYLNDFEQTFQDWVRQALGNDERMVLFIDDLDRCLPNVTLEVLEALKLYLNIPKLMFVVGLDRSVVDAVVREHYSKHGVNPDKASQYLDKIFQVEIDVAPSQQQLKTFIHARVQTLNSVTGGEWETCLGQATTQIQNARTAGGEEAIAGLDVRAIIEAKIERLCRDNPREVKRLLNSTLQRATAARRATSLGGDAELRFAQGAQVFLIDRFIRRTHAGAGGLLLRNEVQAFFAKWLEFVRKHPTYRPKKPSDDAAAVEKRRGMTFGGEVVEEKPRDTGTEADRDFELLRAETLTYDAAGKATPLDVLGVGDLWDLMAIPFSTAVAAATAVQEVAAEPSGASHPRSGERATAGKGPAGREDADDPLAALSPVLRNAIARELDEPVERLSASDIADVVNLNLSKSKHVNDASLVGIDRLTLQSLGLSHTSITDAGLEHVAKLTGLQVLWLDGTSITDAGLAHVAKLTTSLQELGLSGTSITDAGLAHVSRLTSLRWLRLNGTSITDAGLEHVANLTRLQELRLEGTSITDAGVAALKKELPRLTVYI